MQDVAVVIHYSFRLPCGPGGIENVGESVGGERQVGVVIEDAGGDPLHVQEVLPLPG